MSKMFEQGAIGERPGPWRAAVVGLGLLGAGVFVGGLLPPAEPAWGQVKDAAPPEFFKSGGQMSVPLLKEIAATLHQMDGRLERLEIVAKQMQQSARANQAARN